MKCGSLFSGVGGLDLGFERAGYEIVWQAERDRFRRSILSRRFPTARLYEQVESVDERAERVDVVFGGFPCQPVSVAGKGRAESDERWLWPEFERVVRALRPRVVVVENVPGLLADGRGFDAVLGGLAALGFDAEWDVLPAGAVGAPHIRARVFVVAFPEGSSAVGRVFGDGAAEDCLAYAEKLAVWPRLCAHGEAGERRRRSRDGRGTGDVADAAGARREGEGLARHGSAERREPAGSGRAAGDVSDADASGVRVEPERNQLDAAVCGDAFAVDESEIGWWATEPDMGRVAYGIPARDDRLAALGDAVVPQVARFVAERIKLALEEAPC